MLISKYLGCFPDTYLPIYFYFLGPRLQHMEVCRLGVELELQLLAHATATATQDLSWVCDLHHSSWQSWILNPLSKTRDRTCILMDASQIRFRWATMGTPRYLIFFNSFLLKTQVHLPMRWWNRSGTTEKKGRSLWRVSTKILRSWHQSKVRNLVYFAGVQEWIAEPSSGQGKLSPQPCPLLSPSH